jgi:hypothetical protein
VRPQLAQAHFQTINKFISDEAKDFCDIPRVSSVKLFRVPNYSVPATIRREATLDS